MKKVARVIAVLVVLVGLGGFLFAQSFVGEKESSEMKTKRNSNVKKMILHVHAAIKDGKMTEAEGIYRIKEIKHNNAFKNANSEWAMFEKRNNRRGRNDSRASEGERGGRGDRMQGNRRGRRGDSAKKRVTGKNETSALKTIRHKTENIRIQKIKEATKRGDLGANKAAYIIKKIESQSSFKDSNPEWSKYGIKGPKDPAGGRGPRGGQGRR